MGTMRHQSGFTLIEMLIATGIFLVGFVSVYSMFLAGSAAGKRSDALTQTTLATTSLIETLRLRAGSEPGGPYAPSAYNGDGDPTTDDTEGHFVPFPDQPQIWYRFAYAADIQGGDDPLALGFRIVIQTLDLGSTPQNSEGDYRLSAEDLGLRLRITRNLESLYRPAFTPEQETAFQAIEGDADAEILFILRLRGLLIEQEAFVVKRLR
jgi:prepilin-type N-terminal cleavage/methylation domain-containing protein